MPKLTKTKQKEILDMFRAFDKIIKEGPIVHKLPDFPIVMPIKKDK